MFPGRRGMITNDQPDHSIDALLPAEIAEKAEGGGALVGGVYWFIYLRRR